MDFYQFRHKVKPLLHCSLFQQPQFRHFFSAIATLIKKRKQKYYQENQEKIKERKQKYRQENQEKLTTLTNCECGGQYQHNDRARHFNTFKHKNWLATHETVQ